LFYKSSVLLSTFDVIVSMFYYFSGVSWFCY